MISWQRLWEFVKTAIRMLKGRKRDQAAFFVAALCFSGGLTLAKFVPDLIAAKWITRLQIVLFAIGAIALVYGIVRVWRLVNPPELPPAKNRPPAIKGPTAFIEADGDLFRKLGRESELQKLLGLVLDDQVLMVVVRGASGAGKTSLLRAGLKHIVGDNAVFYYWEAVPAEPDKGLLRAIQERWPEGAAKPNTLVELINPSAALGKQSHVVVLDQFEQLRGNRKIFQLLRRIIRESKPPHRITWVIAFRREFSADWMDFISPEQENGFRPPQDVSLRLFTAEQASEVIGQLTYESDLKDSIEQSVIDNLVDAATVDGEVSPVDIGIGLQVLSELHERQSSQTITIRDYQFAGGAEGLLTQYISRCLENFPKESHESIQKAMLALRDPEDNRQRLATGLTIDELALEAGTDVRVLKLQLNRLADRDMRLLETDTPTDGSAVRYRLPHERLIPALYRLAGKLLAEVDQAKLRFQNAFQAWQTNDKRSRYLLKGKELRLVQRYETQIPWGQDEQEKKTFLFRSQRRRQFAWAATVTAVLVLIGIGWFSMLQYQRFEDRRYLAESGYPPALYNLQHQLKKLEMTEPLNLEHFTWLSSDSLENLALKAANSSNSIAGLSSLSRCRSLKELTLALSFSQVTDLQPLAQLQGLKQLTLALDGSAVSDLQPLKELQGLTELTLELGNAPVNNLKPLEQLKGLTQLTLYLGDSQVTNLDSLAQLKRLKYLTLELRDSQVSDLQPLTQLGELTQLTLNLNGRQLADSRLLEQLKRLQSKLSLSVSEMNDLQPLAQLGELTQLSLLLTYGQVTDLQPLTQLGKLTQLTLSLSFSRVTDLQPLAQLQGLKELTLDLSYTGLTNLDVVGQLKGLTHLTLLLNHNQVNDLRPLAQLQKLRKLMLDLSSTQLSNLSPLQQLKGLNQIPLDLRDSAISDLQPLEPLKGLTQLTLDLNGTQLHDSELLEQLKRLRLKLFLGVSQVSDLKPLEQLKELTELTLNLQDGKMSNLETIHQLTSLQTLSVYNATRTQRMSLRTPPRLIELKF